MHARAHLLPHGAALAADAFLASLVLTSVKRLRLIDERADVHDFDSADRYYLASLGQRLLIAWWGAVFLELIPERAGVERVNEPLDRRLESIEEVRVLLPHGEELEPFLLESMVVLARLGRGDWGLLTGAEQAFAAGPLTTFLERMTHAVELSL